MTNDKARAKAHELLRAEVERLREDVETWKKAADVAVQELKDARHGFVMTYGPVREERDDYKHAWQRDLAKAREFEREAVRLLKISTGQHSILCPCTSCKFISQHDRPATGTETPKGEAP